MSDFITTEKVRNQFGIDDFEIIEAIEEKDLIAYTKKRKGLNPLLVTVNRSEAESKNKQSAEIETKRRKENPRHITILHPPYTAIEDCIFETENVKKIWNEIDNKPIGKELSCNAMVKQKVFRDTMKAMKDVLLFYEKNQPAKRQEAMELLERKYPKLTEPIYRELLKAIPASLKRKLGQRDR